LSGQTAQNINAIAIGPRSGQTRQGIDAIAIGSSGGAFSQGTFAIAIGSQAGQTNQGIRAIAIGANAGQTIQGIDAIAIGSSGGAFSQGDFAIAIGSQAGQSGQGSNAIAIGARCNASGAQSVAIGSGTRANNTGAIVLGANSVVSSDNCTAIGTGITNAIPKTTLIGAQATPTEHTVRSTGYIQSARACAAKAIRDFAGGDPPQNISFPTFPQALEWVRASYDTFTTANNAAVTSWSGAAPEYLNIGAVPNATYLASLNVEMNYLIVGGTLNVVTFQIVYDNNGTTERVGIASAQQVNVNYLNYRVSVSGQFRVGAAPTGNQRIYALANSINGGVGIAITNAQLSIVRLV
jgi:hypothetical protein